MHPDPDELLTLLSTRTEFEAEVIVRALESNGIPARSFATSATTLGWMAVDPRPVKVVVRRADLHRARLAVDQNRTDSIDLEWEDLDVGAPERESEGAISAAWLRRWGRAEVSAFLLVVLGVASFPFFAWWFGATLVAAGLILMGVVAMAYPVRQQETRERARSRNTPPTVDNPREPF